MATLEEIQALVADITTKSGTVQQSATDLLDAVNSVPEPDTDNIVSESETISFVANTSITLTAPTISVNGIDISALQADVANNTTDISALEARVAALEAAVANTP